MKRFSQHAAAGFTVVELMISLTVGGIAISSLYAVGAASTRHFREQQRISTTQSSLRSAMNQIKRDFQRAGYLGTPNGGLATESCMHRVGSPLDDSSADLDKGRLAAISAYHATVNPPASLDPDKLNVTWATVSEVILSGNYTTSGEYMSVQLDANRRGVTLPTTTQSFRRDFSNWYDTAAGKAGTCDLAALRNAFPKNRLVRLHAPNELHAFATVNEVRCDDTISQATILFQGDVPNECSLNGGWVSPLNFIRYRVENARDGEASRDKDVNRVSVLRRTEVLPNNKRDVLEITDGAEKYAADDRAVLDYVVRFNVEFLRRAGAVATVDFVPAAEADIKAKPEFIRGAIIELAARTAEHEPDIDAERFASRVRPFRVFNTQGAARTRWLRAELFMPNITYEGY